MPKPNGNGRPFGQSVNIEPFATTWFGHKYLKFKTEPNVHILVEKQKPRSRKPSARTIAFCPKHMKPKTCAKLSTVRKPKKKTTTKNSHGEPWTASPPSVTKKLVDERSTASISQPWKPQIVIVDQAKLPAKKLSQVLSTLDNLGLRYACLQLKNRRKFLNLCYFAFST